MQWNTERVLWVLHSCTGVSKRFRAGCMDICFKNICYMLWLDSRPMLCEATINQYTPNHDESIMSWWLQGQIYCFHTVEPAWQTCRDWIALDVMHWSFQRDSLREHCRYTRGSLRFWEDGVNVLPSSTSTLSVKLFGKFHFWMLLLQDGIVGW